MNGYELKKLRDLVEKEKERRKRIGELQEIEEVCEYLKLVGIKPKKINDSIKSILIEVLSDFHVKESKGIYVCTLAAYIASDIIYQDTNYYTEYVKIDSNLAEYKIYKDIETNENYKRKVIEKDNIEDTKTFEEKNIVLNPYNTSINSNGFLEVKLEYFENVIKYGQVKSKKLLLEKYKRI